MRPFTTLTAVACPLGLENVDTDQLVPARFLKLKRGAGYGAALLADLRAPGGVEDAAFPLNRDPWRSAPILVARRNFGSGSSREAAVYALEEHGIRAVLAPSFGDIFAANAVKNGLLPAMLAAADIEDLLAAIWATPALPVTVDLLAGRVSWGNRVVALTLDAGWREQLLEGWDDLQVTRARQDAIDAFKARDAMQRPWAKL
jgi:3-isopropylmalate/(R)-2-methylmalate dehydratase small subunit